jgi:hypothetical protein
MSDKKFKQRSDKRFVFKRKKENPIEDESNRDTVISGTSPEVRKPIEVKKTDDKKTSSGRTPKVIEFDETKSPRNFKNYKDSDAFIQSANLTEKNGKVVEEPRAREIDAITKRTVEILTSPITHSMQGIDSALDTFGESGQAFKEGDIGGGLLGGLAGTARLGFSAATPFIPALRLFTLGTEGARDVIGDEAIEWATQPITKATEPEGLAARSGAEIADILTQVLLAKGGEKGYRVGKEKINKKTTENLNKFLDDIFQDAYLTKGVDGVGAIKTAENLGKTSKPVEQIKAIPKDPKLKL